MTAVDPADDVQVGLFALLDGDTQLSSLVTGVFDDVPEDQPHPYVVIGEALSTPANVHGRHGRQVVSTLHTWTRARSHRPGNQIGARLVALLAQGQTVLDPFVDGHVVWMINHEFHQNLRDPNREIRHRVDRFRIWTSQDQ